MNEVFVTDENVIFMTNSNWDILDELLSSVAQSKINHAYIFEGNQNIGKKTIALEFSRAIACEKKGNTVACNHCEGCKLCLNNSHPDVITVSTNGKKSIGADDIRSLIADVYIKPFRSEYKIYIFEDASLLTVQAQNALLKVLEEPPQHVIFIILANNTDVLLPTILSRGTNIKFKLATDDEIMEYAKKELPSLNPKFVATLANGIIGDAIALKENDEIFQKREEYADVLLKILSKSETWIFEVCDYLDNNKNLLDFILNLWYSVMYDALLLSINYEKNNKENYLTNSDLVEKSNILAKGITTQKISLILERVILSQKMLARFINAKEIGYNLLLNIYKIING